MLRSTRLLLMLAGILTTYPWLSPAQIISLGKDQTLQQPLSLHIAGGLFYVDSSDSQDVASVARHPFYLLSQYFKTVPKHLPTDETVWIKIQLQSNYSNDTELVFYPGFQNYVEV